jgi:poly(A)-specific ribonuclease
MDIDNTNFNSQFRFIAESLKSASFIALDLEMTGVSFNSNQKPHYLQSLQERYAEQKEVAENFLPIQLGLCPFIQDPESNNLIARPFNILLYPKERSFYFDSGSASFLRKNGLSFDQWIDKGIDFSPFASDPVVVQKNPLEEITHQLDIYNTEFRKNLISILENWKSEPTQADKINIKAGNKYTSKLGLNIAKEVFGDTVDYITFPDGTIQIVRQPIDQSVSLDIFTLMQIISEHKIPIVGHHMQLDLSFLLHHFYGSIPDTIEEWKQLVNQTFPNVIDTRYFASQHPIISKFFSNSLSLEVLTKGVQAQPFLFDTPPYTIDPKFPDETSFINSNIFHNAGYDAFCTGKVFVHFYRYLYNREFNSSIPLPSPDIKNEYIPKTIAQYFNKLPQVWSYFPYVMLDGVEPTLTPQPHHFLIYPIPLDIEYVDLKNILSPIIPTHFSLQPNGDQSLLKLSNPKTEDCQSVPTNITLGEIWELNSKFKPRLVSKSGEKWDDDYIEMLKTIKIHSWGEFCHIIQPEQAESGTLMHSTNFNFYPYLFIYFTFGHSLTY